MTNISYATVLDTLSGDSYDTPEDTPRYFGDHLLFHSRWWFYLLFSGVVLKSGRLARRNTYDDKEWIKSSFEIFRHIEGCGGRFHIKGLDNLKKSDEPLVIVSNHMSTLETIIFPGLVAPFRKTTFVVKKSLIDMPFFGPIMRSRDPIVVGRQNAFDDFRVVLDKGEELIKNGYSLIIFPQSTRSLDFAPEKFNSLGIKLAKKMNVKILPAAIKTDFWGNGKILKDFGPLDRKKPIRIVFGEPMPINGNGKEEHQHCIQFISSHLQQWRNE
ncbi:MAG: lysophospholipid acyltransferase family protein [Candidatus Omnitrophota bacterium]